MRNSRRFANSGGQDNLDQPQDQPPGKRPRSTPPGGQATPADEAPRSSSSGGGGGGGGSSWGSHGGARDGDGAAVLYRVALLIADKKQRSLEIDLIKQAARAQAIELVVDDPSRWSPAAAAGAATARDGGGGRLELDAIVHKISKDIASADAGDPTSRSILDGFEVSAERPHPAPSPAAQNWSETDPHKNSPHGGGSTSRQSFNSDLLWARCSYKEHHTGECERLIMGRGR